MGRAKELLLLPLRAYFRATETLRERTRRLVAHARLGAGIRYPLPSSVVVLGPAQVHGTGNVQIGPNCLLYASLHLETRENAGIYVGAGSVLSRGVHIVSMAGVTLGRGCMIGEYASIRDASHVRREGVPLRDAGYAARPIVLGAEVWVGRGVTIVGGVTIGDGATIGANAVVTRDVPAGAIVAGVPAAPIVSRRGIS